jgi:hypothetical protein
MIRLKKKKKKEKERFLLLSHQEKSEHSFNIKMGDARDRRLGYKGCKESTKKEFRIQKK